MALSDMSLTAVLRKLDTDLIEEGGKGWRNDEGRVITMHGFALADFVFAAASNTRGQLALSINSSISIFKGAKDGKLIAEAREVNNSPKLASFEVNIRHETGDLLATFQGMVYRKSVLLESLLPV
jgi:uncharacterized protein (TIGR00369 family)